MVKMLVWLTVCVTLLVSVQANDNSMDFDDGFKGRLSGGWDVPTDMKAGFVAKIDGYGYFENSGNGCGGVIINTTLVLTTASCVYLLQYATLYAGMININDNTNTQYVDMVDKYLHPDFERNTGLNDIAIIRVYPPFQFNDWVYAIDLPKSSLVKADSLAKAGVLAWFSWGSNDTTNSDYGSYYIENMQVAQVNYMLTKDCSAFYSKQPFWYSIPNTMMCMGFSSTVGVCAGDGGYPVVGYVNKTGQIYLAGLSGVDRDNICPLNKSAVNFNTPDLFLRIDPFYKWIALMGGPSQS